LSTRSLPIARSSALASLRRPPAGGSVTDWLREAIVSGRLPRTAPLSEPAVSQWLGVSRGPVREAFRQLAAERLLVVVPRVGTFIAATTAEDVEEIYDLRRALEVLALRLLPARLHDADRAELAVSVNAIRRALAAGDLARAGRASRGFHAVLIEKAGSRRLRETFRTLTNELRWLRVPNPPERLRRVYRDHLLIAEAVLRDRWGEAERRLVAHLDALRAAHVAQVRRHHRPNFEGGAR
jgi:DNA-binding GntR family transcriptional regulator